MSGFTQNTNLDNKFFAESIGASKRGTTVSVRDAYGPRMSHTVVGDAKIHDSNFAFLTTTLAKLHKELYEPLYFVTWQKDIPFETGGGFVDFVEYYSVNWAGIMNQYRNVVGNGANYIPRVNAGLNQMRVKVYTYEVAYDLRFIELEKMKKLTLQKSIQEIYNNAIVAGWDLFVQDCAYTGIGEGKGLFNSDNVLTINIPNKSGQKGFDTMEDTEVVAVFNGIFERYLSESNMNTTILPDTILVPTFVMTDLTSRFSALYTSTLYNFLLEHNLGAAQSGDLKLRIEGRPALDKLGGSESATPTGRIVAYKKAKQFVRIDIPYPIQHYITLPNIDKMSYTSAFVGQVSEIQMPYNTDSATLGVVTYWDFTNGNA